MNEKEVTFTAKYQIVFYTPVFNSGGDKDLLVIFFLVSSRQIQSVPVSAFVPVPVASVLVSGFPFKVACFFFQKFQFRFKI